MKEMTEKIFTNRNIRKLNLDTSIKVNLDNCKGCIFCYCGSGNRPVFCEAVPGMFESKHRLDDVRQIDENGNYCRTPPAWCPLRSGKVIVEKEE